MAIFFGDVPGFPVGSSFADRKTLRNAGLHRFLMDGISHEGEAGADAIVLSGGYEDDQDLGDEIIYTGFGGRDPESGSQIKDQEFIRGNLALGVNRVNGYPVRVIRGHTHKSKYSPKSGYRYDGLYSVEDYWHDRGKSGFIVWRYRLRKIEDQIKHEQIAEAHPEYRVGEQRPNRVEVTTLRIVRDTKQAREIKRLYDYHCQVCGMRIETPAGCYAEAAHIRPLGKPHNGSDALENLLCLCPNHHVMFDEGVFVINEDMTLVGIKGRLQVNQAHKINMENVSYHAEHYRQLK